MKLLLSIIGLVLSFNIFFAQTMEDNKSVLQLSLDINEFQTFFQPEVEGRIPLVIFNTGVVPEMKGITKFDSEVLFWDTKDIFFYNKKDYLVFKEFEIDGTEAVVHYSFPIEGAYAKISLEKEEGSWLTRKIEVGEY